MKESEQYYGTAGLPRPVGLCRDGGDVDTQGGRKRYFSLCEYHQA